jgi:hypothetical protein
MGRRAASVAHLRPQTSALLPSLTLAAIFAVVMAATTVTTPLYPRYEAELGRRRLRQLTCKPTHRYGSAQDDTTRGTESLDIAHATRQPGGLSGSLPNS